MTGASLNQYRVTASIGAGGMGEVFRARDTRLNRDVAIKVLPKDFVSDADRLRRFEQEAKTLAALNHPNVLTIHDAGVHEGAPYLVSELLEGKTLREDMNGGALPLRKATEYALQIAHGLAAAHGKEIIHRDLKPENIFVTKDGRVKILDFGLAKLRSPSPRPSPVGREREKDIASTIRVDPDAVINTTEPGMVLGTPAYMSPEQVRGEPADHRADIFAFGAVLYEMLSGARAFRRDTPVESMNAVLNDALPELSTTHPHIPLGLARIVERCLDKQPDNRFQSAKDLAFAIEAARDKGHPVTGGSQRDTSRDSQQQKVVFGIAALVLLAAGIGWWFVHQPSKTPKPGASSSSATNSLAAATPPSATNLKSIAVLPFVSMSADKADEYLSDGMTEELLNVLAKVPGLRVPGRSSSFAFKGKNEEGIFRKVGEQLHVTTVLEGSVRKAGDKLRITAQLINVADGFHLWSETYDAEMKDILTVQSDVAQRVVQALQVKLGVEATRALAKASTENPEAHRLYLLGRHYALKVTDEDNQRAIEYFNQALKLDPSYARAYSGLADTWDIRLAPKEMLPLVRAHAETALKLDPELAEAHCSKAWILMSGDWDFAGAEREFALATRLNPNLAWAYDGYGWSLMFQGRFREAEAAMKKAVDLEPLAAYTSTDLATVYECAREFDKSVELAKQAVDLDPRHPWAHHILGWSLLHQGKPREAMPHFEQVRKLGENPFFRMNLGCAYAAIGDRAKAEAVIRELDDLATRRYVPASAQAYIWRYLNEKDRALTQLERSVVERDPTCIWFKVDPALDILRGEPRFQALLKKVGFDK